ncbi:hypothetical protein BH10ACT1_BH10ACT1_09850 [soil metagenome]
MTGRAGRWVAIALVAVLAVATSCSGSGSDAATTTTVRSTTSAPSTTVAPKADVTTWAQGFCGDFGTWIDAIRTAGSSVGKGVAKGDVTGAKAAIVKLFTTSEDATDALIESLEAGGTPDLTDGGALVEDLKAKFGAFKKAIVAARGDAEALSTGDPAAFATQVDGLVGTFQSETTKVGDSFAEIDTKYPSSELQAALSADCGA